jgi:hypothetical protein
VRYLFSYHRVHAAENFAGNLLRIEAEYLQSPELRRDVLDRQCDAIADALVMKNGVKKTTYQGRLCSTLAKFLGDDRCALRKPSIRVLDVPSSMGLASLSNLEMLSRRYLVERYVLGDLHFVIHYDRERECIYDEEGNLLQVKRGKLFFSIYRSHSSGDVYTSLTRILLTPFDAFATHLKKRYPYCQSDIVPLSVMHPAVSAKLRNGIMQLKRMNVFEEIPGTFDLILSFNLLQRNYFGDEHIARGLNNLQNALAEGGFLVVGDTHAFRVSKKRDGKMVKVLQQGEF